MHCTTPSFFRRQITPSFSGDSDDMPGLDGDNEEDNDNMPALEDADADAHDGPVRLVWLTEKFAPTYLPSSPTLTLKGKFPIHNGSHTMAPHYDKAPGCSSPTRPASQTASPSQPLTPSASWKIHPSQIPRPVPA